MTLSLESIEKMLNNEQTLMEYLAALEHDRWSKWHKHCVKNWNVAMVSRWNEQANTNYSELSESEKESDRREVRSYWPIITYLIAKCDALLAKNKKLEALNKELVEYTVHEDRCASGPWEAGEPTPNGGYRTKIRGKWYQSKPIDETPKCDCGLESLVAKAKELGI